MVLLFIVETSFAPAGTVGWPGDKGNRLMSDDRAQVVAVTDEETSAIVAGDAGRYFAVLTEDCVMMPPGQDPKGGESLRRWLREFLATTAVEVLWFEHGPLMVAGDLAFHDYFCGWKVRPRAGGAETMLRFKGLHVLRREDGWKIVRNIWNLDQAG